jgi:hypothetical protein
MMTMRYRDIVIENILVVFFGILIFYLDNTEFKGAYIIGLIFLFALTKSIYFILGSFRRILKLTKNNIRYHEFLLFIALNISLIIFSFAIDYICLFQIDPTSFSGISPGLPFYQTVFKFFSFSVLIFSNLGVAKIIPESMTAEALMIFEAMLSFITIIFILSDFVSLKESLNEYLLNKKVSLKKLKKDSRVQ